MSVDGEEGEGTSEEPLPPEINAPMEEELPGESSQGRLLCTPKLATRIHEVILKQVITQLHSSLVQKVGW